MRLLALCSLALLTLCFARIPSYNELLKAPTGIAKDYYIYRYAVEKKPSKARLRTLRSKIWRYQGIIKQKFDSAIGELKPAQTCSKDIKQASLACQRSMLKKDFLQKIDKEQLQDLAQYFKSVDNDLFIFTNSFMQEDPVKYILEKGSLWAFYRYFLNKQENIAKEIVRWNFSPDMWKKLNSSSNFKSIIHEAIILNKYPSFRAWLLNIDANNTQGEVAFYAGLNAILANKEQKALGFFKQASQTSSSVMLKDASLFWAYLISKEENLLESLYQSNDINMYSLYARELIGKNEISVEIPEPKTKTLRNYNISDPFTWQKTRNAASNLKGKELEEFAKKFYTKNTLGEYSFFMERASGKHYYPLPFMENIGTDDIARQALILAIARQESRFIPSAISTSYALGMMQFMPFLARDIGHKKLQIPRFQEDDLFKPQIAYKFANYHLDYLEEYLKSPIFIAYAYNGGIGFTKKMLLDGKLFSQKSRHMKYEPFLSMELVPYAESRLYAKKVLANYVVYSAILGSNIKISQFFENLMIPGVAENFRSLQKN